MINEMHGNLCFIHITEQYMMMNLLNYMIIIMFKKLGADIVQNFLPPFKSLIVQAHRSVS